MSEPVYYTIGEISGTFGLPLSTLRFYDKKGIFVPEFRNPKNGYRYYSSDQLPQLDLILFLLEVGVSANQVPELLGGITSGANLIAVLQKHSEELDLQMDTIRRRKEKIRQAETAFRNRDLAVGRIRMQTLPERRVQSVKVSDMPIYSSERRYRLKQAFGKADPRQSLPIEMLSMGTISSLPQLRLTGQAACRFLYRELAVEEYDDSCSIRSFAAGAYLTLRFTNTPDQRDGAYIYLLRYIDDNGLKTGDELIEVTEGGIPPVVPEEEIYELQVLLNDS